MGEHHRRAHKGCPQRTPARRAVHAVQLPGEPCLHQLAQQAQHQCPRRPSPVVAAGTQAAAAHWRHGWGGRFSRSNPKAAAVALHSQTSSQWVLLKEVPQNRRSPSSLRSREQRAFGVPAKWRRAVPNYGRGWQGPVGAVLKRTAGLAAALNTHTNTKDDWPAAKALAAGQTGLTCRGRWQ